MMSVIKLTSISGTEDESPHCYLLQVDEFRFLLDCGWDEDLKQITVENLKKHADQIDAVLLSHPDPLHLGALPYLVGKLGLSCPVFATIPVCEMGKMFMTDLYQSRHNIQDFNLFTLDDVDSAFERIIQLKYLQTHKMHGKGHGLQITPLPAGHMVGGTIWKIVKDGEEFVYAVDYNSKGECHLNGCHFDGIVRPRLLITDAFNADCVQKSRIEREEQLMNTILQTVRDDGNVLIATDTAGRVLELACLLDQMRITQDSDQVTYSLALLNNVAADVVEFAKAQVKFMSDEILKASKPKRNNPFCFNSIQICNSLSDLHKIPEPKVVLASVPDMQCGFSRELFVQWCGNPKNCIVLTNRTSPGTLSRYLVDNPLQKTITLDGAEGAATAEKEATQIQTKCISRTETLDILANVLYIDFEGRSDGDSIREIITQIKPRQLILVRGNKTTIEGVAEWYHSSVVPGNVLVACLNDILNVTGDGQVPIMFQNIAKSKTSPAENSTGLGDLANLPDIDTVLSAGEPSKKTNRKLSVERIYQKKTQHEHILLRPDTYIGSVEKLTQLMWVYDESAEQMVQREITFVPGLYKIFDEILVNAADNKQRDPKNMNTIKIDIDPETNKIKIWNNGKGIPVVQHETEKMYVPSLLFGYLLTSSNYDDTEKKVTGGRNGYGAKLCNVFSSKFVVETQSSEYHKYFRQIWTDNMMTVDDPKIEPAEGEDFTSITFYPDLTKFEMATLDKDIVDLFTRRAYDVVASSQAVKVFLNGNRLGITNFREYVELYTKDKCDELNQPLKIVHEVVNDRWEVAVTMSDNGFQHMSFVNGIATTRGGRHVDLVTDQIIANITDVIKKKEKKGGVIVKPSLVKSQVWVFVNALIENPTFDSQAKEHMTLPPKNFGSKCQLSEKFMTLASKCGIVEAVQNELRLKEQEKLNKTCSLVKKSRLLGIPKLDDANDAGLKHSIDCTLILTEGDSAKTLAVAGLSVIGRDRYGVYPLRGKLLNVREATHKQIMENAEINAIITIIGLQYQKKYETIESLQSLRYGKIMIMTDQDEDGSHIKGLIINFIHNSWPNLLKHNFVEEFITPIIKVTKNQQQMSFFSLPQFAEWKSTTENWQTWKCKYYKGLGTSTAKEAKEYFSDMNLHRIPFRYTGPDDDAAIVLAFSKKKIEERKEWLSNWMEDRKRRAQNGLPQLYLYGNHTRSITYKEFVYQELILFSNMDNERSIPSVIDGFKPGQRKVIFTCIKRNLVKELKVAQLAGSVAELSAYHHGEQSVMATIINLAQNFLGSNNLNILQPIGQFGTRLNGGADAASPRYIFTMLSTLARHIFKPQDDALLRHLKDDNLTIEPEYYIPIVPMVLVNGAEGIGTGWSTKIPKYNIREIVSNIQLMINGRETLPMLPSFKNFKGTIEQIDESRWVVSGEVSVIDSETVAITELPIGAWTRNYRDHVLVPLCSGPLKDRTIKTFKEHHTNTTVRFVVAMEEEKLSKAEATGLHTIFKLQTMISSRSMVLFDSAGCLKRYTNVKEILQEFYNVRLMYYEKRKDCLVGTLRAESLKLDNQSKFIAQKIDNIISIENKSKKDLIELLVSHGYDSDPVKAWKTQDKLQTSEDADSDDEDTKGPDFNYILNMQLWCLSKERKDELLKQRDAKAEELRLLRRKTAVDLWKDDLANFLTELDKVERQQTEDDLVDSGNQGPAKGKGKKKALAIETKPSPIGRRIVPSIEALRSKVEAAKRRNANKDKQKFGSGDDEDDDVLEMLYEGVSQTVGEGIEGNVDSAAAGAKKNAAPKRKPRNLDEGGSSGDEFLLTEPQAKKKPKNAPTFPGSDSSSGDDGFLPKSKPKVTEPEDEDELNAITQEFPLHPQFVHAEDRVKYNIDLSDDDDEDI